MRKYPEPESWIKPGAKVYYSGIIGRPHDGIVREIRSQPWKLGHGTYVVLITDIAGGVSLESLHRIEGTNEVG